jgi:hypothetical protein
MPLLRTSIGIGRKSSICRSYENTGSGTGGRAPDLPTFKPENVLTPLESALTKSLDLKYLKGDYSLDKVIEIR